MFNGNKMLVSDKDVVDINGTMCMVIVPWRAALISLLTGATHAAITDAARQRGVKVSIAGHDRYKKFVHARNKAQSTNLLALGSNTVSGEGVNRLFGGGDDGAADQPPVFPRRKRKRDGDEPDADPPGMLTVEVDGARIECVRPMMSRETICVPLDAANISALLDYLHVGINSIDDITGTYEWTGRYPGRYKKARSVEDVATPTKSSMGDPPCSGQVEHAQSRDDVTTPSRSSVCPSPSSISTSPRGGSVYQQLLRCSPRDGPSDSPP